MKLTSELFLILNSKDSKDALPQQYNCWDQRDFEGHKALLATIEALEPGTSLFDVTRSASHDFIDSLLIDTSVDGQVEQFKTAPVHVYVFT